MAGKADSLEEINRQLKSAGIRLKLVVRNRKLSLRGIFPPRLGETKPKQTYLALKLDHNPYGLRMGKIKAHEVWAQLGQGTFSWEDWTDTQEWETCRAWIERYKKHWFAMKGDTEETRRKWHRGEWLLGLKWLPPEQSLTAKLLKEVAQIKPPNSRSRQRLVQILTHLANFAQVKVDLSIYQSNYSSGKVQPRNIPSDEEIAVVRTQIKNPQWRLVYERMACYGLRDHECWHCEIGSSPPYACRVVMGKTGNRDGVMPLYPEWAKAWQPWEGELPQVTYKGDRSIYGERTARAFKRIGVPFSPYNLRHAWNIRGTVVFKIPIPVMAQMAGHSSALHLKIYNRWITQAQNLEAYTKAIMSSEAPKAPSELFL